MPLTLLLCADSVEGDNNVLGLVASSSMDSLVPSSVSDCIPIIAPLSLHSALTKSQNAVSSKFFDASNNL